MGHLITTLALFFGQLYVCKLSTGTNCLVGIKEVTLSRLSPLPLGAGEVLLDLVIMLIEVT